MARREKYEASDSRRAALFYEDNPAYVIDEDVKAALDTLSADVKALKDTLDDAKAGLPALVDKLTSVLEEHQKTNAAIGELIATQRIEVEPGSPAAADLVPGEAAV